MQKKCIRIFTAVGRIILLFVLLWVAVVLSGCEGKAEFPTNSIYSSSTSEPADNLGEKAANADEENSHLRNIGQK